MTIFITDSFFLTLHNGMSCKKKKTTAGWQNFKTKYVCFPEKKINCVLSADFVYTISSVYLVWSMAYDVIMVQSHITTAQQSLHHQTSVNSSPTGQNGHHKPDYIFRCIFLNGKKCILITIPLEFVRKGPIHKNRTLVYIMAWHRIGDKLLSETMLIRFTDAYMRH